MHAVVDMPHERSMARPVSVRKFGAWPSCQDNEFLGDCFSDHHAGDHRNLANPEPTAYRSSTSSSWPSLSRREKRPLTRTTGFTGTCVERPSL